MKNKKVIIIVIIILSIILITTGLLFTKKLVNQTNNSTTNNTNETEDQISKIEKEHGIVQKVESSSDIKNSDFELDSIENLKKATNHIVDIFLKPGDYQAGTDCSADANYLMVIATTNITTEKNSFNIREQSCFNKQYLSELAKKYLTNESAMQTCSNNFSTPEDTYMCSLGFEIFDEAKPKYESIEDNGDTVIINYAGISQRSTEESMEYKIKFTFKKIGNIYKLHSIEV